ncbi:hypothetical protein B0T25DRAFT_562903 [Lasiosphaeria hispida]|uniref:BZIP domain-containing protein n=1 Tax=Lasiosphaeria hispida TaxID=260671 RepID=A0AAJ0HWF6_9PEZI|nr:hypothetical protein B0T25DRAFT_562903 [Lasiosphaeria hispida]
MIIGLPDGAVEFYVGGSGTKAVSERRQRNARASARFRQRKKRSEKEQDERIAALQKEVEEKDRMIDALQERIQGLEEVRTRDSCNYTDRGTLTLDTSTFARRLGQELSIPVCELDSLFHKSRAGGVLSEDDARRSVQALVESSDEWILDGNHWVQLKDVSYNKATDIICKMRFIPLPRLLIY